MSSKKENKYPKIIYIDPEQFNWYESEKECLNDNDFVSDDVILIYELKRVAKVKHTIE